MTNNNINSLEHKTCTKCGEVKLRSEFRKNSASKDGIRPECKKCSYISNKKWVEANRERVAYTKRKWAENNPEKVIASKIKYYEFNKDKVKQASLDWKKANSLKVSQSSSVYFQKNKEKIYKYKREWGINNQQKLLNYYHKYRNRKANNGIFEIRIKFLKKLYSSPCVFCGSMDRIEADHVIPVSRGGRHCEGNLQPLCRKCNASKSNKLMVEWIYLKGGGQNANQ